MRVYRAFKSRPRRKLRTTPNFLDRRTRLERFSDHSRNTLTEAGNRLGNADAIGRICLGAVGDVALLDVLCRPADLAGRAVEQSLQLGVFIFRKRSPGC
jgi:hypothetical protein